MISLEVWHTIQVLKRQGLKNRAIARQLGISRNTVQRYWQSQAPPKYERRAAAKGLDPFAPQIQEMVAQRFIGTRIFAELSRLGYNGSLTSLYRYLKQYQSQDRAKATIRFETEPEQQMLDDLIAGKALGYSHTPMRHLTEVLGIPPEKFDEPLQKWYEIQKIAWEDELAERGYYNERTFRSHLWFHTSQQTPQPIFVAALVGVAAFKHVRLPKEAVNPQGEVDFALVGQVIRGHFRKKKGATHVFGDIVSYILKRFYHDSGLEFGPDGRLLATEAPQESSRAATLTCGQKELSPKLLAQVVDVSQDE